MIEKVESRECQGLLFLQIEGECVMKIYDKLFDRNGNEYLMCKMHYDICKDR